MRSKGLFENKVFEIFCPRGFPISRVTSYSQHVLWYHFCSDPTSNGQASVYLCHPWISMLAHTVHQCIYQSAITCINNVKLIYTLQISAETDNRVWSPINAIGKLSVDRNPVSKLLLVEEISATWDVAAV
jgi:hypothetical protein